MVGTSVVAYTYLHKSSVGRKMDMLAKNAAEARYVSEYDNEVKNVRVHMVNVEPVDSDWFFVTVVRMGQIGI